MYLVHHWSHDLAASAHVAHVTGSHAPTTARMRIGTEAEPCERLARLSGADRVHSMHERRDSNRPSRKCPVTQLDDWGLDPRARYRTAPPRQNPRNVALLAHDHVECIGFSPREYES